MKATELLNHIGNNIAAGKPAAYNLVLAATGEPAESYKLNFDHPEHYQVRQYPEFIRKGDDIMNSPGIPGMPPAAFGVDYQKLNQLIYERTSQKPTTAACRVFYSETDLRKFAIEVLRDYVDSGYSLDGYFDRIKTGRIEL